MSPLSQRNEILQGTLDLMVLHALHSLGPLHGYGVARRLEQVTGDMISLNQGTIYPALLRLVQHGFVSAEWGVSDTGRRARFYAITRAGRKHLAEQQRHWERTVAVVQKVLET
jgi:PadR family transcriptional regulator PadR